MSRNAKNKVVPPLRFPEFTDEWEDATLGQIGNFVGGGTPDTTKPEYWDGNIQWYTPTEVKGRILERSKRTITEEGVKNSSAKLLPVGSLLITTRATIGDVGIADCECTTNQGFQSLIVNSNEVNTFWYYWLAQNKGELVRKSSGSTFPEIGKSEIVKIRALRPDKKEQQKIADCLSSLDDLITAHIQKLVAVQAHKKGLMHRLFPAEGEIVPKYRYREFEKDGEWTEKVIEDYFDVGSSKRVLEENWTNQGIPFYRTRELVSLNKSEPFGNEVFISEELFKELSEKYGVPTEGDFLVSGVGTLGISYQVKTGDKFYFKDGNVLWFKKKSGIDSSYFKYCFQSDFIQKQIFGQTSISTVGTFTIQNAKKTKLCYPASIAEQRKIANCLSSLDEVITAQMNKIDELKKHKKGLMHGMFPHFTQQNV